MKKNTLRLNLIALSITLIFGCAKSEVNRVVVPTAPTTPTAKLIALPSGWKLNTTATTGFPDGIELYTFDGVYEGKKTKMFCLAVNPKNQAIEFKPVLSTTAKKLSDFNKDETGKVLACINGGYFSVNQSFSLVKYNGAAVLSANIKVLNRTYNSVSTAYYPTRAAFGINSTGEASTAWIYHVGGGNDLIYQYPTPNQNVEGTAPKPIPTETFPSGGAIWNISSAIGGSPMLLRNGNTEISDVEEMISINNTTSRPRTAIGYTNGNIMLMLVVEGDNVDAGYEGMNLVQLAGALKTLGCTNAINLDGGGSSSMIVGNQLLNRPGNTNGAERAIVSAVLVKQR
jgi:hypothetical protein